MTEKEAFERNVRYLMQNAGEALDSAEGDLEAGRNRFAMSRIYFACFYATSAALLIEGRHFVKHAGVRAALHRELVLPGHLAASWGGFYDEMFDARHHADYGMFVEFDDETVAQRLNQGRGFVSEITEMLKAQGYLSAQ